MKTIAIDAHVLTGIHQGSRTYLENILRQLGSIDRQNRYQIFSFDPAHTRRLLPFANFEHHRINVHAAIPRLLLYWPLAKLRYRFDVLVTQYILPPLTPGPHLVVMHDILPETHPQLFPPLMRWRSRFLFRLSARRARDIFVVSDYTRRQIAARYRIPEERIHLTYNGFDAAAFATDPPAAGATPEGDYILYVGRLEPRKNVDLLIEAVARLAQPCRLILVGKTAFTPPALLDRIGRSPFIEHREGVDEQALDRLYRGAAVFVYPSSAEGFGLPVLEALARGAKVITTNQTALPETGGEFVRYFDPHASDAIDQLAALIEAARGDATVPDRPALAAHLSKFDWERSARTVLRRIAAL